MKPQYKIYPSLLDAYQRYIDTTPETFFYQDASGRWHINYSESKDEYTYSPDEVDEMAKEQLLAKINRLPYSSLAATRGTAFNEIIDSLVNGSASERAAIGRDEERGIIVASVDGESFGFPLAFCEEYAERFKYGSTQVFTKALLGTSYGGVELYGFADVVLRDKVIDIKTGSRYTYGDYENHWQRHAYPYCLVESGDMGDVTEFVYSVVQLSGNNLDLHASYTDEVYSYDHEQSRAALRGVCERFIEFLEGNRNQITDKKIFNEQ